ncbi:IS110 family transposase, partial [Stenotrophomonas maltophilia]|nr:IS110 family transposase [Stenotrophomonas maltophilia]
ASKVALVAVMRKMLVILNARKRDAEVALSCP